MAGTQYRVVLQNQSGQSNNFFVYATDPGTTLADIRSVVWWHASAHPHVTVNCTWTEKFSFIWSQTGNLVPGVHFIANQSQDADPQNASDPRKVKAFVDKDNDGFFFGDCSNVSEPVPQNGLLLKVSRNVPANTVAVGVGINGEPALVVPAAEGLYYTFYTHLKYWVAFGNYTKGHIVDVNVTAGAEALEFPIGKYTANVILNEHNQWSITYE